MIIRSELLSYADFLEAARDTETELVVCDSLGTKGTRWNVRISGSSKSWMDSRNLSESHHSATWDEWGWFLKELFDTDENAICGRYKGRHDFIEQTEGKFQQ